MLTTLTVGCVVPLANCKPSDSRVPIHYLSSPSISSTAVVNSVDSRNGEKNESRHAKYRRLKAGQRDDRKKENLPRGLFFSKSLLT